ncbi:MAG: AtpZ/AtpI family protein [Patescibacteria group bacterium]|jgi:F0F1-type ATP synthase assembly protein I
MSGTQKQDQAQQNPSKTQQNKWQQTGLKLAFELSGWLVGPLVLALFVGNWLDNKYQTKPWLFLLSVGIAFAITCIGIVKETMQYIKDIEKEAEQKKSQQNQELK